MVNSCSGLTLVRELSLRSDEKNVCRFGSPEPVSEVVLAAKAVRAAEGAGVIDESDQGSGAEAVVYAG